MYMKKDFSLLLLPLVIVIFVIQMCSSPALAGRRALLVGIQDYLNLPDFYNGQKLPDLKGPKNDINAVKDALCSIYGFSEDEIMTLLDNQATRRGVEAAFFDWLIKGTKEGDLVLFYFSGHGGRVPDIDGDEEDHLDEVLCMYDMVPKGGYNVLVDDELSYWLKKLSGRTVVVIIASCYSGGTSRGVGGIVVDHEAVPTSIERFIPISGYQPSSSNRAISPGADIPEGVIFMTASKEFERAQELQFPEGFYGGFTFGLCYSMKSLRLTSYQNIFHYARKMVIDTLNLPQNPQIKAPEDMLEKLAFLLHKPTTTLASAGNQPTAPPAVVGEKLLVSMEKVSGSTDEEMKELKEYLNKMDIVQMVEPHDFFDRLIRGEKNEKGFSLRLLNRLGDVERIAPGKNIEPLIDPLRERLEYAYMVKQLSRIHHPNPPFRVNVEVADENKRDFLLGEKVVYRIKAEKDCYILLINVDSQGAFHIIFPNKYHKENFIKADTLYSIPDKSMELNKFEFLFTPPAGEEMVKVIAVTKPFDLKKLGLGDFTKTFQIIEGQARITLVKEVIDNLSKEGFEWSEDTVTFRTYRPER